MTVTELIPIIRTLPLGDKWQLLKILQIEVADTDISPFEPHQIYHWWTPYPAFGVADALLKFMQEENQTDDH